MERRYSLVRGFISVIAAVALFMFLLLAVLHIFMWSLELYPIFAFVIFWGGMAAALAAAVSPGYFRPAGKRKLASILDGKTGRYRSLVSSAEEFSRRRLEYSPYLVTKTIQRAEEKLEELDSGITFEREGRPGWTAAGLILCVPLILMVLFAPERTRAVLSMVSDPGIAFRDRGESNIMIRSGNISVLEGTPVQLEGVQFGSGAGDVTLRAGSVDGIWRDYPVEPDTFETRGLPMVLYRRKFDNPVTDFRYYFRSASGSSDTMSVNVIHRPVINRVGAELSYPGYTGRGREDIEMLAGRLKALRGTEVTIEGESSKDLLGGEILFSSGLKLPLEISGSRFRVSFTAEDDDTFHVRVSDSLGYHSRRRVIYPVEVREDLEPEIEIERPSTGEQLPRSMMVDLYYRAGDDFGLSEVNLLYKKAGKENDFKSEPLFRPSGNRVTEVEQGYSWSLEGNNIMPGDRVLFYLEARDNNTLTGPGYARTETRKLLVPSLSQMYAEYRDQESSRRNDLEEIYNQGEEVKEKLRELSLKFKAEGEMNWAKKKEGEKLIRKYENLREKVSEVVDGFEKSLNTLQQNRMTSMRVGRKLEQIRDLVSQIENSKLAGMIEKMNRIMNELPEDEVNAAMDEVETSMEEMMRSMDRTIEYLREIMREEKLEALMRRMEDMLEKQKQLRDSTRTGDLSELAEDQEKLSGEAEELEKELGEFTGEESDRSGDLRERAQSSNIDSLMKQAASQMNRQKRDSASCTQKKTVNDMLSLYTCMGSCQMNMNMSMDRKMKEAIERAAGEIIQASRIQEEVLDGFSGGTPPRDLIDKQLVVKGAVRRVTENLSGAFSGAAFTLKNVFLQLGSASLHIEKVLRASENFRDPGEKAYASRAMTSLNRAVMEMLKASSSQSGSGQGMKKKMTGMMKQQFSIDNRLREMYAEGNRAGLSMEERAEMARMAARQRRLEELMKQIETEGRSEEDLLGDISGLSSEMDSVAAGLERGELDEELLDRENRILSRMLQAQRSINRRDYKKERTSRSAEFVWGSENESFRAEKVEEEKLLKMIREAMREKGPREYRELIRLYFRALSERIRESGE